MRSSPELVGTRRDDGSAEIDQPGPGIGRHRATTRTVDHADAVGDEDRQPIDRVACDRVEGFDGVSVAEVARPAGAEPIEVSDDVLDGEQQPFARGDLTKFLAGGPHGLARGPAVQEGEADAV